MNAILSVPQLSKFLLVLSSYAGPRKISTRFPLKKELPPMRPAVPLNNMEARSPLNF